MRSPSAFRWLLAKEWRELRASRAWWVLLALTGPLVGLSFASGVSAFAEVSAGAGTGCGLACNPLVGVWGPTFSAYEITAVFLLPFVAIRLLAGDRQHGTLVLEMQRPIAPLARIAAKALVLAGGWMLTGVAAVVAIALWHGAGGHLAAPELGVAALGHVLNGALTIALALAIAAMTDHPSTAAIIALAFTIGTWVIDFAAAMAGGIWVTASEYTPASAVAAFQHGLLQTHVVAIEAIAIGAALAVAAIGIQSGRPARDRALRSIGIAASAIVLAMGAARLGGSWDASDSRMNSFSEAEEQALASLPTPLRIDVHLAPQDPRRRQFERGPLAKLRRAVRALDVRYTSRTGSGLYEQTDAGYGDIRYTLGDRSTTTRVMTDEGALEAVFDVAPVAAPPDADEAYPGYPFTGRPAGTAIVFYGLWPALVAGLGIWTIRRHA